MITYLAWGYYAPNFPYYSILHFSKISPIILFIIPVIHTGYSDKDKTQKYSINKYTLHVEESCNELS